MDLTLFKSPESQTFLSSLQPRSRQSLRLNVVKKVHYQRIGESTPTPLTSLTS